LYKRQIWDFKKAIYEVIFTDLNIILLSVREMMCKNSGNSEEEGMFLVVGYPL